jgi:peptidoglycan hydrolase-like protein with peptidoglycan-binding domain
MYKTAYDLDREIAIAMREIEYMDGFTDQSNLIPLAQAPNEIRKKGWKRGVYVIFKNQQHVYVGQSIDLPARIGQHRLCLTHLKISPENFQIKVFHYPNANENTLKAKEREYRNKYPKDFTQQNDTEMDDFTGADLDQLLVSTNEVLAEISAPMVQGVNRSSSQYTRWIQTSLNQILGISLVVDGIMGPQTRNAIRRFQKLAGLEVDGIVGPKTEAALVSFQRKPGGFGPIILAQTRPPVIKPCPPPPQNHTVDSYERDSHALQYRQYNSPEYETLLDRLFTIVNSRCSQRIVRLIGHTSLEGLEDYNMDLGQRRAEYLMARLKNDIRARLMQNSWSFKDADNAVQSKTYFDFRPSSQGATQPVIRPERTEDDRLRNRRVNVRF